MRLLRTSSAWATLSALATLGPVQPAGSDMPEVKARGTLRVLASHD
jgi:hypothetical protein